MLQHNREMYEMQKELAWADIKDSQKTKNVLVAQAVGIETIKIGKNKEIEVLKLNYNGKFGYLPKELLDDYEFKGIQHFVGKHFEFIVQSVDLNEQKFIANRKAALPILAKQFWKQAAVGQSYAAFVRGMDAYNVYLLIEGVPATLHRDDVSHVFIEDLRSIMEIGDTIEVKITELVKPNQKYTGRVGEQITAGEDGRLRVSRKALEPDPWANITNYREKSTYLGTISHIHMDHGLFIELEPGLSIRTNFPPSATGKLFKIGQQVNVKIMQINVQLRQIKAIVIQPRQAISHGNNVLGVRGAIV